MFEKVENKKNVWQVAMTVEPENVTHYGNERIVNIFACLPITSDRKTENRARSLQVVMSFFTNGFFLSVDKIYENIREISGSRSYFHSWDASCT